MEVSKFASGLSKQFGKMLCQHYLESASPPVFGERHREFWDILRENEIFSQDLFKHAPSVERLYLSDVQLSKSDIQSLTKTIRAGKLPQLVWLNLSINNLSGMEREVEALFAACDVYCEERLCLWLSGTALSEEFIQRCKVKYRNVQIPFAETLDFFNVQLSKADLQSITRAIKAGKLPQLLGSNLSFSNLSQMEREVKALIAAYDAHCEKRLKLWLWGTGLSEEFTERCRDKYRRVEIPSAEILELGNTQLSKADIQSITSAITSGKLPKLNKLSLSHNDLSHIEREVEALMAACDAHCQERLWLYLWDTGLSREFVKRCRDQYHNVGIYWR